MNVNGTTYDVELKDEIAIVNGVAYAVNVTDGAPIGTTPGSTTAAPAAPTPASQAATPTPNSSPEASAATPGASTPVAATPAASPASAANAVNGESHNVPAPLPGLILRTTSKVGATVTAGDTLLVVESMKMERYETRRIPPRIIRTFVLRVVLFMGQ